jgi:uncharacterized protein YegP (UPF0339 family)
MEVACRRTDLQTRAVQYGWLAGRDYGRERERILLQELEIIGNFLAAGSFTDERVGIMRRRVDTALAVSQPEDAWQRVGEDIDEALGALVLQAPFRPQLKFKIFENWRGEFYWQLVFGAGQVLAVSNCSYSSADAAKKDVKGMRSQLVTAPIEVGESNG